jgi:predicted MFS family arabinose efflux permease
MKRTMVRYKIKADRVAENERYITSVFEQLKREAPLGLRYATFKLEDGVSFMHIASLETEDGSNPLAALSAFKSRAFTAGNTAGFLFFASLYGSTFFLAQFLQTALGYGPLGTGLCLLPWTIMLFVSAPLAGVLVSRFGERTLLVGGLLLQAVAMAWIGLIARPDMAYADLVAPLIIAGFGAAAIPAGQNAVVSAVALSEIGKASGVFNMLRQLGATFGVAILVAVFASVGGFGSAQAFSDGFAPAMGMAAALALAGAVAGMGLPSQRKAAVAPAQMQA